MREPPLTTNSNKKCHAPSGIHDRGTSSINVGSVKSRTNAIFKFKLFMWFFLAELIIWILDQDHNLGDRD